VIFTFTPEQRRAALSSRDAYHARSPHTATAHHDRDPRRTPFYFAEDYHQQYLAKNPDGYCPRHAPA